MRTGEFEAAAQNILTALKLQPRRTGLWQALAEAYRLGGKLIAAAKAAKQALELEPHDPRSLYQVASIEL
jgi:Tfp pilus assembly protein PilF